MYGLSFALLEVGSGPTHVSKKFETTYKRNFTPFPYSGGSAGRGAASTGTCRRLAANCLTSTDSRRIGDPCRLFRTSRTPNRRIRDPCRLWTFLALIFLVVFLPRRHDDSTTFYDSSL